MKRELSNSLRCPACLGGLELRCGETKGELVLEGELACRACGRVYAVRDGAAYLAVLDERWAAILKELANRREIVDANYSRPADVIEEASERERRLAAQNKTSTDIAESCFAEARGRIDCAAGPRVLDVGAGMFETSHWFAARGAKVTATETDIGMVRYANFRDVFAQPPRRRRFGDVEAYERNPEPFSHYFNRVVCDIHRLPFAAGAFDVAFCRAMLHHVDDLGAALRELARVTRPGGQIVCCAEPIRSILDREADYNEGTVDREEGMNEQTPTLLAYRRPLAPLCDELAVQYWPQEPRFRTKRLFDLLHYRYARHLWPGEEVRNWKWVKLLLAGGGINLYARRAAAAAPPPPPAPDAAALDEVTAIYHDGDEPYTLEALRAGTERIKALRRSLLVPQAERLPHSVEPGRAHGLILERGWSPAQRREGQAFRFLLGRASIVLRLPERARRIRVEYGAGGVGQSGRCAVRLNGLAAGELPPAEDGWERVEFPLSTEVRRAGGGCVVQAEFHCLELQSGGPGGAAVGPAVRRVSVV